MVTFLKPSESSSLISEMTSKPIDSVLTGLMTFLVFIAMPDT